MIKNRVVICLVVVITMLQAGVATAQQFPDEEESFHIFYFVDIGMNKTSHKPEVSDNWRQMFLPPSGGMTPNSFKPPWTLGFGLGYNRHLAGNSQSWQIRLPISYQIFSLCLNDVPGFYFAKEVVAGTTLDWWDKVILNDLVVEHFTPRVGIEVEKEGYGVGLSVQHYRLSLRDYKGKDHYGAKNTSRVINSRQIESGVSLRMDLFFAKVFGAYMETMGGFKTVRFGLTARLPLFDLQEIQR